MKYFCAMHETLGNISPKAVKAMQEENLCPCCGLTFTEHPSRAFDLGEFELVDGVCYYDKIDFCNCFVTVFKGREKQTTKEYHHGRYKTNSEVVEAYNEMEQESRAEELEEEYAEKRLALP